MTASPRAMKLTRTTAWLGLYVPFAAGRYHLIGLGYLPYDPLRRVVPPVLNVLHPQLQP